MLLAIDIGNTNITFGVFKGNRIIKKFDLPTKGFNRTGVKKNLCALNVNDAIICSVVPKAGARLVKELKKILGKRPIYIGKDILVPIRNLYRKPKQVGCDRLVGAYAGIRLYGSPLIIVDFGTAITFDVVSKHGQYLGGMILPGLRISLEALTEKTALLPKLKLDKPREFIGKDTKNSMLSGLIYGFAALTDELTKNIKDRIGKTAKVIGTGGNISLVGRYCTQLDRIDRDLILKGLRLIYAKKNA